MEYSSATMTLICNDNEENKEKDINSFKEKASIKEIKLKLPKKVTWTEDTIDNEHMNLRKSKSN
jgi:hypothetical protein